MEIALEEEDESLETSGDLSTTGAFEGYSNVSFSTKGWKSKTNTTSVYGGLRFKKLTTISGFKIANGTDFGVLDFEVLYSDSANQSANKLINLKADADMTEEDGFKIYRFTWSIRAFEIIIRVKRAYLWPGFRFDFFTTVSNNQVNGEWLSDITFKARKIRLFKALNFRKGEDTKTYPEFFVSYNATTAADLKLKRAHLSLAYNTPNTVFVCYQDCKALSVNSNGYLELSPVIKSGIIRISLKSKEKPNVSLKNFRLASANTVSTTTVKQTAVQGGSSSGSSSVSGSSSTKESKSSSGSTSGSPSGSSKTTTTVISGPTTTTTTTSKVIPTSTTTTTKVIPTSTTTTSGTFYTTQPGSQQTIDSTHTIQGGDWGIYSDEPSDMEVIGETSSVVYGGSKGSMDSGSASQGTMSH